MLVKVCSQLEDLMGEDSTIFRLGGDGFVIVFEDLNETSQAEKLAIRLLKGFKSPFELDGSSLFVTVSMGIALYPDHGDNMEELLKNADIALYKAKETGKNRIVFYNKPMDEAVSERVYIEKHLRTALDNNEFELYYQPQIDIATKNVSGLEALIRWNSSELGFVSPLRFISIAEDTHMIIPIGEWVLRNACIYLKKLHQQGYEELTMSVNISMVQLIQEDFLDMVMDTLDRVKLNPKYLELEITESTLMESYEIIESKLELLKEKGLRIALDDFGKGYSSLNYLRQLPIATLKIDKSFIDTIGSKGKHKSLTSLMIKIGKTMGLNVVAEGVETQEQMDYLVKNKCDRMQGYLFSKPMPEELVIDSLAKKEWSREMTNDNEIVEELE
jgi:predicted signal transduction protein with EAL and GGDEF domain